MESKKAQKRAVAKAKRERRKLMLEAHALLKNSVMTEMKGNTEAAQRLRVQAANRRAAATLVRAPTPGAEPEIPKPIAQRTEVELLEALEAVSFDLRRLMTNARLSRSPHRLRNHRRKYQKVQHLHPMISSRIAQSAVPNEDWSLGAMEIAHKVFTYGNTLNPPYDLFPDQWANEPSKVKELVQRAIMREFWKQRSRKQPVLPGHTTSFNLDDGSLHPPSMWAPCLHTSAGDGRSSSTTNNRFAVLQNEAPAPRDEDLRQELRQLQNHMSHLQRRLDGHVDQPESSAQGASRNRRPAQTHHPQHERQTLAPRRRPSPTRTSFRGHNTLPPYGSRWPRRKSMR
ncbi:hypothetical protein ACQ4PT_066636 [Festuca glaucescens]